jgi:hypothetical protein
MTDMQMAARGELCLRETTVMTLLSDVPSFQPSHLSAASRRDDEAFVIEAADVAAGVIVRQQDGYRFFAANDRFQRLDGSVFKTPKAAQQAADLMQRAAARNLADKRRAAARFLPDLPWS